MNVNSVIDYFGSQECCLAAVVKIASERYHVKGLSGQLDKIAAKQILSEFGDAGIDVTKKITSIQAAIQERLGEVDLDLLYDDLQDNGGNQNLREITQLYFGNTEPLSISAMARALMSDAIRFKRVGNDFVPRSPEEVAEIRRMKELRAQKNALKERLVEWLKTTVLPTSQGSDCDVPEEAAPLLKQLLDFLMRGTHSDGVTLLSSVPSKLSTRSLALSILQKTNSLPEDADTFLLENGIHAGFSPKAVEEANNLPAYTEAPNRKDYSNLLPFSIDDAETRDIDDALACTLNDDGSITAYVFIADPAFFIQKDSELDAVAVDRPLSMYLPTTTISMFPEILSYDHASLVQNTLRPCLAFHATYDDDDLLDWGIESAQVKIAQRLTYTEADELIANGNDATSNALRSLVKLSKTLKSFRDEDGAVTLNKPEMRIRVRNNEISIVRQDTDTPSHKLVSELMILINNLAARYALINDIPIIYRAQERPSEPVHSVVPYDPCIFDQQVRKMRRTRLSTYPSPHFGLGLDLYTQVSSPLRRYADLVIQRQLSAHLQGAPLPYKQEELYSILDNVDKTAAQNKALEREANNYWTLEYIKRNKIGAFFKATVVRQEGALTLAELDELFVRGVVYTRDRPRQGDVLNVKIRDANPKENRLILDAVHEG